MGDTFAVQVLVKDLRDDPRGVFSAYLDVQYDPSLVSLEDGLEFGDIYVNGLSGEQTDFESGAVVVVQVSSQFQNSPNPFDTNADGHVSPLDVLFGVNRLNEKGPGRLTDDDLLINGKRCYLDVNGDNAHSPADILAVINQLNAEKSPGGEGEPPAVDVGGTANARQSAFAGHAMPIDAPIRTYSNPGPVVSPGTANKIEAPLNTHQENHGFRSANANDASSGQDTEVSGRIREIDRILAEGPFPNEIDLLSLPLLPEA